MAELAGGSVLLDSRQFAGAKVRRSSVSRDGGQTWSPVQETPDLADPSCMASTLRYSFADGPTPGRLLHSGPDSAKRERGTIYLSRDEGKSYGEPHSQCQEFLYTPAQARAVKFLLQLFPAFPRNRQPANQRKS